MNSEFIARACAGAIALLMSSSAIAWGPVGHAAVGGIADRLLFASAREQVALLLARDVDKHGNPSGRTKLEEVASWADEVRQSPSDRPMRHYDDIQICGPVLTTPEWCPANGECATHQIEELKTVLADASKLERDRNEALKWIVHLVGDLHQPLHAADNVYRAGKKDKEGNADDRGGNDVAVTLPGSQAHRKLHGVWDTELVSLSFGQTASDHTFLLPSTLDALAATASQIPPSQTAGTPLVWAKESNRLARTIAYKLPGFKCGEPDDSVVPLSKAYVNKAEQLIPKRIELGGVRLARLLNELFGAVPP